MIKSTRGYMTRAVIACNLKLIILNWLQAKRKQIRWKAGFKHMQRKILNLLCSIHDLGASGPVTVDTSRTEAKQNVIQHSMGNWCAIVLANSLNWTSTQIKLWDAKNNIVRQTIQSKHNEVVRVFKFCHMSEVGISLLQKNYPHGLMTLIWKHPFQ